MSGSIPANDWAAVGARLERCVSGGMIVELSSADGRGFWGWVGLPKNDDINWIAAKTGKTPLEALTAALDAAEGARS